MINERLVKQRFMDLAAADQRHSDKSRVGRIYGKFREKRSSVRSGVTIRTEANVGGRLMARKHFLL